MLLDNITMLALLLRLFLNCKGRGGGAGSIIGFMKVAVSRHKPLKVSLGNPQELRVEMPAVYQVDSSHR